MKIYQTEKLQKAIYAYKEAIDIKNRTYWGDDYSSNVFAISGYDAKHQWRRLAKIHKRIKGKTFTLKCEEYLIDSCLYVFRFSKNGETLIPYRVSMHPKTIANYEKGHRLYGVCEWEA